MAQSDALTDDFCFVHAADLHLDTPFKGIGETAPSVAVALREASLEAFDNLVTLCLERKAAFLVIAGDVYDGAERGIRAQLRFLHGLTRLSDAGIQTFVVHGNHDPVESGWSAVGAWPRLATIFGTKGVEAVPVRRDGRVLAVVQGISYWRRDVRENLSLRFARRDGAAGLHIGLLHCNVGGASEGHEDYSPCSLDDLRRAGIDYWALGHIHTRLLLSGRPYGDEPWIAYPGDLQARSPKPSERGAKGAFVVEVRGGRVAGCEFVACDRIRYAALEVDASTLGSIDGVRDALADAAHDELAQSEGRSIIVRATIVGRSEAHAVLQGDRAGAELLATLRDEFRSGAPWCWWDGIEDASAPVIDLEELRGGSDFPADLIDLAEELTASCAAPALALGLEAELPAELLDEITTTLPKGLRTRALASELTGSELLAAGLRKALDELGVGVGDALARSGR
jgi:DNA repair exonuclease SbcCD nuclease subunit